MGVAVDALTDVRASPLLSELNDAELETLASMLEFARFPKGRVLFEQEAEGDALYLLTAGQVGVVRRGGKDGKERLLAVVGAGECIGEMALADGGPRSATITALEDVEALAFSAASYRNARDSDPKLAVKLTLGICRLLSKRLRQINKSLEIVHYWMFA